MKDTNNLFVLSLIWSIVSEFETNNTIKFDLIKKLFKFMIENDICSPQTFAEFTEDSVSIYETLYTKFKLNFHNSIDIDYHLQNGRYEGEFRQLTKLGKGGFGCVYKAYNNLDQKEYALKKVTVKDITNSSIKDTLKEIKVWSSIDNEFMVQYKSAWFELTVNGFYGSDNSDSDSDSENSSRDVIVLHIQMELCDTTLKEVSKKLNDEFKHSEQTGLSSIGYYIAFQIFLEICEGVNYLHSQKPPIIHRDIKLSNILIKTHSSNRKFVKICDFGLTTYHNRTHTQGVGTPDYIAPEVYNGRVYDQRSDIYSIGVVMSKLLLINRKRSHEIIHALKSESGSIYNAHIKLKQQLSCHKYVVNPICNTILLQTEYPHKRPFCSEILNNYEHYSITFDQIRNCTELTELYYKWYRNDFGKSKTLNQLLLTYLKTNLFQKSLNKTENIFLNQISLLGNYFKTNLNDDKLVIYLTKILIHGLNVCNSVEELKLFIELKNKAWKCIIVRSETETVMKFIESLSKHNIDFYIYYDTSNRRLFVMLNYVQFFLINFLIQKFQKSSINLTENFKTLKIFSYNFLYEIENNEELVDLIILLNNSNTLDDTLLFNCYQISKLGYLFSESKFIYYNHNETYIFKNDGSFFQYHSTSNNLVEINGPINNEIISIANNASHKMVLTSTGVLNIWGRNNHGQLGNGTTTSENKPKFNAKLSQIRFSKICSGDFFTVALDECGKLFSWGRNNYGQVGCGGKYNQFSPIPIDALKDVIIIDTSCGTQHSIALCRHGKLYSWGNNYYHQLGLGDKNKRILPTIVSSEVFDHELVIKIECNKHESYILTCNGNIFKTNALSVFKKLNGNTDRFLDICLNHTELLVALSTNEFCYVYGLIENNIEPRKFVPILTKTSLKSIQNCFFVFTLSQFTYEPLFYQKRSINTNYAQYILLQKLFVSTLSVTNSSQRSNQFSIESMALVKKAIKNAVSFHSVKLLIEESTTFRCYVSNSTRDTIDNFIALMTDSEFNYLLMHDSNYDISIILLDYIYYQIIDFCFEKNKIKLNLKCVDMFPVNEFIQNYAQIKFNTTTLLTLTNWRVLRTLPKFTLKSIRLLAINYNKVFYITRDDEVYSFGDNNNSCLGLGYETEYVTNPSLVDELCGKNVLKFVFASEYMAALTKDGHIYTWGDNYKGRLGHRNETKCLKPTLIAEAVNLRVKDLYCCTYCIIILTENNDIFKVQNNFLNRFTFYTFPVTEKIALCRAKEENLFVFTEQNIYIYYEKGLRRVLPELITHSIGNYRPKSFAYVNCNSADNFKCYFLSFDGNIYEFNTENQVENSGLKISKINDDRYRFADICYSKFTRTFVAHSTRGNCFIMNSSDIKVLTETPIMSVENALAIYCDTQVTSNTIAVQNKNYIIS